MARLYSFLLLIVLGAFVACSDHSALTQTRQADQPVWNSSGPNFTGSSSATGPVLSDIDTISLGSTVVSNVVVDANSNLYVIARESAGVFTLYKISSTSSGASIVNQYGFTKVQDQTYINIVIDSNNSVYFSYNDSLHVIPNVFGTTGTSAEPVDLEVATFDEHAPVLDGRGRIIVLKKQTGLNAKVGVYSLYDLTSADFTSIFESSETFTTNVMPMVVDDKLFIHTSSALLQYDLLNISVIVPVQNPVSIVTGSVPVRALYVDSLDLLAYEYVDGVGNRTGLRLFNSNTGAFISFLSYNANNQISMFMGVGQTNRFKFLRTIFGNSLVDYQFVSNQLSILSQTSVLVCDLVNGVGLYHNDLCDDSIALERAQAGFFTGDDSVIFTIWDSAAIRLKRFDSPTASSVVLAQSPNDVISIATQMTDYLDALFPNATDNQFPGFYSFDRPTLLDSKMVLRNGSQLFIVR